MSKLLNALAREGKGEDPSLDQYANQITRHSGPVSLPGQDDPRLFDAQIAQLMGAGPSSFSLPEPADMGYLDEQIEEFLAGTVVNSLPKEQPLPVPHWTDRPTAGPQLTRGITDAFTMCYAVYRLHAGAVVQDPRVGGPMPYGPTALRLILLQGVPNLADERLKQQAWQFFSQNWARLDEGSRRWIADMPHLWEWFQSKDRQGKNLHPFEQKVLLERYGPFFQWFEGAMRWYQGPRAEPSGASA